MKILSGSVEAGGIASSSMTTTKAASSYPTEEQKIELFKSEIDYSETNNSESFNRTKRGTGWDVMELIGKTACRAALLSDKEEKRAVTEAPKKRKTKNSPKKTRYEDE